MSCCALQVHSLGIIFVQSIAHFLISDFFVVLHNRLHLFRSFFVKTKRCFFMVQTVAFDVTATRHERGSCKHHDFAPLLPPVSHFDYVILAVCHIGHYGDT